MKPNLDNPFGYKVCYRERGCKDYIRHFLTYTYSQARQAKMFYIKYPQRSREDEHLLDRPEWVIIPVKKSEVRAGIWHEVPFWKQDGTFNFYKNKQLGGRYNDYVKSYSEEYRTGSC